jgi:alpha-tubulin suppressor-like RCC1 family protein
VRAGAVGSDYQCVITRDGHARCGGGGEDGKIAQGSGVAAKLDKPAPVPGLGDEPVRQIAAGMFHACALTGAGAVKCWGSNAWSHISDESLKQVSEARLMPGLPPAESLVAGGTHTCALAAGRVYCWGDNLAGQLGDGTRQARATPRAVPELTNLRAIAAGRLVSCAIDERGDGWCWGSNTHGELGSPGSDSATPRQVEGLRGAQQISCGNRHCCALVAAGQLKCWGGNEFGELGNGLPSAGDDEPAKLSSPQTVIQR